MKSIRPLICIIVVAAIVGGLCCIASRTKRLKTKELESSKSVVAISVAESTKPTTPSKEIESEDESNFSEVSLTKEKLEALRTLIENDTYVTLKVSETQVGKEDVVYLLHHDGVQQLETVEYIEPETKLGTFKIDYKVGKSYELNNNSVWVELPIENFNSIGTWNEKENFVGTYLLDWVLGDLLVDSINCKGSADAYTDEEVYTWDASLEQSIKKSDGGVAFDDEELPKMHLVIQKLGTTGGYVLKEFGVVQSGYVGGNEFDCGVTYQVLETSTALIKEEN